MIKSLVIVLDTMGLGLLIVAVVLVWRKPLPAIILGLLSSNLILISAIIQCTKGLML